MATGLTPSEELVARLCQRSFLKLWTHPNPIGKNGKELCDCLIVCGQHILIISVKEVEYQDTGNRVGWDRWHRVAVEKSVKQIWGAERSQNVGSVSPIALSARMAGRWTCRSSLLGAFIG